MTRSKSTMRCSSRQAPGAEKQLAEHTFQRDANSSNPQDIICLHGNDPAADGTSVCSPSCAGSIRCETRKHIDENRTGRRLGTQGIRGEELGGPLTRAEEN